MFCGSSSRCRGLVCTVWLCYFLIIFTYFLCLFDLILYVPSTIFQLNGDGSSWVEPVLSWDICVLLKDYNTMTPVRLEPAALRSRVITYFMILYTRSITIVIIFLLIYTFLLTFFWCYSDFFTCASCIFCALFFLWDAKFLFQWVPECIGIADLSWKIVFWTHAVELGLIDMGNSESQDP